MTTRAKHRLINLLVLVVALSLHPANPRAYPAENPPIRGALIIVDFTEAGNGAKGAIYFFYRKTLEQVITTCGQTFAAVVEDGAGRPDFLKQLAVKYKRATNKRWISKKKQQLVKKFFHNRHSQILEKSPGFLWDRHRLPFPTGKNTGPGYFSPVYFWFINLEQRKL